MTLSNTKVGVLATQACRSLPVIDRFDCDGEVEVTWWPKRQMFKLSRILVAVPVVVWVGCSSTHSITRSELAHNASEIEQRVLSSHFSVIRPRAHGPLDVERLVIDTNAFALYRPGGVVTVVPIDSVREVVTVNIYEGGLIGLLIGVGIGSIVGPLLNLLLWDDRMTAPTVGAGAMIGLSVGLVLGNTNHYEMVPVQK